MVSSSIFAVGIGIFAIVERLFFLSICMTLTAAPVAFVAGYLMRADETALKRHPHLPFLYVEGDQERPSK